MERAMKRMSNVYRLFILGGGLSVGGIALGGTLATVIGLGMAAGPLGEDDIQRLASGSAQEVLAIVCGMLVIAVIGLSLVISRLFRYMERRHVQSHEERDRREKAFHQLVEDMLVAVSDSTAARRECNEIMKRVEATMDRCQEQTTLLTGSDVVKVGKK